MLLQVKTVLSLRVHRHVARKINDIVNYMDRDYDSGDRGTVPPWNISHRGRANRKRFQVSEKKEKDEAIPDRALTGQI